MGTSFLYSQVSDDVDLVLMEYTINDSSEDDTRHREEIKDGKCYDYSVDAFGR